MKTVYVEDLGRVRYAPTWDYQQTRLRELVDRKRANRGKTPADTDYAPLRHYLLFCEHEPVYTLGKSGSTDHLLLDEAALQRRGIDYFPINRGGDITYHGPGQVVGYPILDLEDFFTDVHRYVRSLEETVIRTCNDFGLEAIRLKDYTGVWLPAHGPDEPYRKICAIGVHLSRWCTLHGFALNVNTDLRYFEHIVPCGIADANKTVTSLAAELGETVDTTEVLARLRTHFGAIFECTLRSVSPNTELS